MWTFRVMQKTKMREDEREWMTDIITKKSNLHSTSTHCSKSSFFVRKFNLDFSIFRVKIEFLDKNLTFRIVWLGIVSRVGPIYKK